jgi:hypothetical protein
MPQDRRTPWPAATQELARGAPQVGIVIASFNTRRLVAQLVFSLYRMLGRGEFAQIVVVDNASTDGSRELLEGLHEAGLINLVRNRVQEYHGPALTRGVSWLARRQRTVRPSDRLTHVWVLDSDVIVLRPDSIRDALRVFSESAAAMVGQRTGDASYDRLLLNNSEMLQPCSLLFDPARIWRTPFPPFVEDWAPATALQVAVEKAGLRILAFPFVEQGYLLHLGRGTLREVAETGDTTNRYHQWAVSHRDYHFAGRADGPELYRSFCDIFASEVGELDPDALVEACRSPLLLSLGE